jgi:hypothetical protein
MMIGWNTQPPNNHFEPGGLLFRCASQGKSRLKRNIGQACHSCWSVPKEGLIFGENAWLTFSITQTNFQIKKEVYDEHVHNLVKRTGK